jgi:hypothetical protein
MEELRNYMHRSKLQRERIKQLASDYLRANNKTEVQKSFPVPTAQRFQKFEHLVSEQIKKLFVPDELINRRSHKDINSLLYINTDSTKHLKHRSPSPYFTKDQSDFSINPVTPSIRSKSPIFLAKNNKRIKISRAKSDLKRVVLDPIIKNKYIN